MGRVTFEAVWCYGKMPGLEPGRMFGYYFPFCPWACYVSSLSLSIAREFN